MLRCYGAIDLEFRGVMNWTATDASCRAHSKGVARRNEDESTHDGSSASRPAGTSDTGSDDGAGFAVAMSVLAAPGLAAGESVEKGGRACASGAAA